MWLKRRFDPATGKASWRQAKLHRVGAKKWCQTICNVVRTSTIHKGLVWLMPDDTKEAWQDPVKWPGMGISIDQGSDGVAGLQDVTYVTAPTIRYECQ